MTEPELLLSLQDELVQRAESLVRRFVGDRVPKVGKTQLSRAMEVAQSAGTLRVFLNWLRYQAAREAEERARESFWTRGTRPRTLAAALNDDLAWLRSEVARQLPEQSEPEQERVTMRAATRLLGYFRRALIGAEFLGAIGLEEGRR